MKMQLEQRQQAMLQLPGSNYIWMISKFIAY